MKLDYFKHIISAIRNHKAIKDYKFALTVSRFYSGTWFDENTNSINTSESVRTLNLIRKSGSRKFGSNISFISKT